MQAADRALVIRPDHAEATKIRTDAVVGAAKLAEELSKPAVSPAPPADPPLGNQPPLSDRP